MSQYYYLKNQIDGVYACVDSGIECFFNGGPAWTLQLYFAGVLAAVAENDLAKADAYLKDANKFVETNNLEAYTGYLRAFEVELALKTNDVESAWRLHRTAKYATHPPFKFYYIPQFTQIKLYIAKGDPDLMREAHFLIEEYKKMTGNLAYAKIQIMLLEAVWFEKSHLNERAEKALAEALMLVPEDEYIRVFLDMGEPVYKMMLALPEKQKQTHLVRNILMAFKYEIKLQPAISGHFNLTSKEMELMEMVASGMQNKEIASQLFLSNTTIKTYLYRIYQKLEVKNRLSAIRKIRDIQSSR
jgi:LuxR family maltose regulon positive regulatory protein